MNFGCIVRRRLPRGGVALIGALGALALGAGCGGAHAGTTTGKSSSTNVQSTASATPVATHVGSAGAPAGATVSSATVGPAVPQGFVGISLEEKALEQFAGTNPKALDQVFLHLIENLAPQQSPVLRIGGDSTDWSWWPVAHMAQPPGVKFDLTPGWMAVARALASDLKARLILGVDLEANSAALAAAEAKAMVSQIGSQYIDALELGNEPELYGSFSWYRSPVTHQLVHGRPLSWSVPDYISNFDQIVKGLPNVPIAGPSMGGPEWLQQLSAIIKGEPRLKLVTVHAYPLKHCTKSTVVTAAQLLADSSSHGLAEQVTPFLNDASRAHDPLRIDEMNGISCGGTRGVSDTFASALWMVDTLFEMARAGVGGVNVHTVPNTINELIGPEMVNGSWAIRVHPEYYGMMMFAQAAPAGSHLLKVSTGLPSSVKVWATRATDGTIRAVIINKQLSGNATVALKLPSSGATAAVEQLRAPSVHATSGVTLGGQTFGSATTTGTLGGQSTNLTVAPTNGTYTVTVPAASATMLTIPNS